MRALTFRTASDAERVSAEVARHLAHGGLLAYPTETVYGLGSRAVESDVSALAALKGRREGKPFLLLVASRAMAEAQGLVFSESAMVLADRFWPGPVTLVLPGGEGTLPESLRGPERGVAVRWTSHPAVGHLVRALDFPITSTSANRPGMPTAPGVGAILDAFGPAVQDGTLLVLDGGVLGSLPPSTVIDCTRPVPRMIREGAVPIDELRRAVGSLAP